MDRTYTLKTTKHGWKKWHTVFMDWKTQQNILWLSRIYFQHKIFKFHPCCSIYQNFIPFKDWIIMIVYHILFIHLLVDGHLGCFYTSAIMKNAAEHLSTRFCVECAFISLGYVARSEIAGLYGNSMFNYSRKYHMVFQSSCTISCSHQ